MLNKEQSEVWKALGHGEQWVLRDELAELQKNLSTENQKIAKPNVEGPNFASPATKTPNLQSRSFVPSALDKQTAPSERVEVQGTSPQQASSAEVASAVQTESDTTVAAPKRTQGTTRTTTKRKSTTTLSKEAAMGKPTIGSRHVDVQQARDVKRIDFIKNADWATLEEAVNNCTVCDIGKNRLNAVFGQGHPPTDVVLIGEGPGEQEDQQGRIFVGQSGMLLDKILRSLKIRRGEDVAILNTLKCRPPNNANPQEPETAACRPFLERQLELLDPKLIVAMGKPALKWIFRKDVPVKSLRGRVHDVEVAGKMRKVIVTFHPSYLLRTPIDKGKAWLDWLLVLDTMRKLQNDEQSV
ncbi:MAG: uracil-DNA glycosylase [Burkholderiales bacterium]|nr:uracil-DNA glycosylase [Burkholderiales bacterium]